MPRLNCWEWCNPYRFLCAPFIYTCYSQSPRFLHTHHVESGKWRDGERDVNCSCCCCFAHSNFIDIYIQCRVHTRIHTIPSLRLSYLFHFLCMYFVYFTHSADFTLWVRVCTPSFYTIAHISKTANEVKQKTKQSTQRLCYSRMEESLSQTEIAYSRISSFDMKSKHNFLCACM